MKRLHGASRLGMMLPNADRGAITGAENTFTRTLEKKNYELTDHLGNVRSVITDMKLPDGYDKFLPEATTRNYYYPFGMERPLMTASTGMQSYRYGYNGMEKDNAVSPTGVTGANYSTDFREIDTRIGRWWSRDPIVKPWESPYVTFGDNPIAFADPSGLDRDAKGNIVTKEVVCEAKRYEPTPEQAGREYTPQYHYEPYGKVFKFDGYDRTVLRTGNQGNSGKYGSSDELWTYINGQWTYSTIPGNNEAALKRLEIANEFCDGMQWTLPVVGIGIVAITAAPTIAPILAKASIPGAAIGAGLEARRELKSGEKLNPWRIGGSAVGGAIAGGFGNAAILAPTYEMSLVYGTSGGFLSTSAQTIISGDKLTFEGTMLGTAIGAFSGLCGYGGMQYLEKASKFSGFPGSTLSSTKKMWVSTGVRVTVVGEAKAIESIEKK